LAIALHDDAMKDWWTDPKDGELMCVSYVGFIHAKTRLEQARKLRIEDAELQQRLALMAQHVNSAERRKYAGSWLMVVVLSFFWIIPGVLWWLVNRRPGYLLNHDYMVHAKSGKISGAAARMGGLQGKIYDFFSALNDDWGWLFGLGFMLTIGVVLSPIFMIVAFKQNYLDAAKPSGNLVRS
jgi:hypothetical protein